MKKLITLLILLIASFISLGEGDSTEVRSFRADALKFKLDLNRLVINMPKLDFPKDGVVIMIRDHQRPGIYYKYVYKINLKKKKHDPFTISSSSTRRNK